MKNQLYNNQYILTVLKTSFLVFTSSIAFFCGHQIVLLMARSVQQRLKDLKQQSSDFGFDVDFDPEAILSENPAEEEGDKPSSSGKKPHKHSSTSINADVQEVKLMVRVLTDTVKDMSIKLDNIIAFQKRYEDNLPAVPGTSRPLSHSGPTHLTKDNFQL